MALSTVVKNNCDGTITLSDGAGSPATLAVGFDMGDLSIDGLKATQRETATYESRGVLKSVRHTSRTYPSGSFSFMLKDVSDASDQTLIDFCLFQGSYSSGVSTLGASAECKTIKVLLTIEGTDHGDGNDHTISLDDCEVTMAIAEGDPSTVSISFVCYGAVAMT